MRFCRALASLVQHVAHIPSPPECSSSESEHESLAVGSLSSSAYLERGTLEAWPGCGKEAAPRGKLVSSSISGAGQLSAVSDELGGTEGANVPLALAVLIGCLPLVVVYVSFVQQQSAWGAIVSVEAVFALVPLLVLWVWPAPRAHVLSALLHQPCGLTTQLSVGLAVGIGSFVGAAIIFELLERVDAPWWGDVERRIVLEGVVFGFSRSDAPGAVWFGVWFTLVNPPLEELFWRVFLKEALSRRATTHCLPANAAPRAVRRWTNGRPGVALLWLCTSVAYASYHANVLFVFLPTWLAAVGMLGLVGFGLLLQLLVDRVGLLSAVLTHVGADAVVVLGLTDAIFDYLRR